MNGNVTMGIDHSKKSVLFNESERFISESLWIKMFIIQQSQMNSKSLNLNDALTNKSESKHLNYPTIRWKKGNSALKKQFSMNLNDSLANQSESEWLSKILIQLSQMNRNLTMGMHCSKSVLSVNLNDLSLNQSESEWLSNILILSSQMNGNVRMRIHLSISLFFLEIH